MGERDRKRKGERNKIVVKRFKIEKRTVKKQNRKLNNRT